MSEALGTFVDSLLATSLSERRSTSFLGAVGRLKYKWSSFGHSVTRYAKIIALFLLQHPTQKINSSLVRGSVEFPRLDFSSLISLYAVAPRSEQKVVMLSTAHR